MGKYTEEKLNKMSVHTLRVILRSEFGGVPGVCNKSELISQILDIQGGASAPARSTKGRKPLGEFITPISEELIFSDVDDNSDNEKKGVFELNADGYGFVRVNKNAKFVDFFVPKTVVKKYSLRTGDEVVCLVYYANEVGALNVKTILSINGRMPEKAEDAQNDTTLKAKYPEEKISLERNKSAIVDVVDDFCPIGKGQRCLVEDFAGKYGTNFINTLLGNVNDKNLTIISLFAGVRPEEIEEREQTSKHQNVVLPIDVSAEGVLRIINLTVERAKTLCKTGENVLLVLDSLSYFESIYDEYLLSGKNSGYLKSGLSAIKYISEIFGASGNFGNNRSLTIIATIDAKRNEKLYGELISVATSNIKLISSDIINRRGYVVDIANSYTDKDEALLSQEQILYADEERRKLLKDENYLSKIYCK